MIQMSSGGLSDAKALQHNAINVAKYTQAFEDRLNTITAYDTARKTLVGIVNMAIFCVEDSLIGDYSVIEHIFSTAVSETFNIQLYAFTQQFINNCEDDFIDKLFHAVERAYSVYVYDYVLAIADSMDIVITSELLVVASEVTSEKAHSVTYELFEAFSERHELDFDLEAEIIDDDSVEGLDDDFESYDAGYNDGYQDGYQACVERFEGGASHNE